VDERKMTLSIREDPKQRVTKEEKDDEEEGRRRRRRRRRRETKKPTVCLRSREKRE